MDKKFETIKKENFVELVDDVVSTVYMKDGKEIIETESRQYLFDYALSKLKLSEYEKVIVITCLVPNGCDNAITNKKGVWGLTNQHKGIFEDSYLSEKGKVYFGVTSNIQKELINGFVKTIEIYIPQNNVFPCGKVFDMFSAAKCDLISLSDQDYVLLVQVQKNISNSIIVEYTGSSVRVYGDKIERLF